MSGRPGHVHAGMLSRTFGGEVKDGFDLGQGFGERSILGVGTIRQSPAFAQGA
jgi:hypothetical protein